MALRIENPIETIVGAVVIGAAALFAYIASQAGGGSIGDGYRVKAAFSSATGVSVGTDVRVAGVKVGRVSALALDQDTYFAAAELTLRKGVQLPVDSIAKVSSENLLGGSFIALEPGIEDEMMADGSIIEQTQGAADLLDLLQQFGGSSGGGESKSGSDESASADSVEDSAEIAASAATAEAAAGEEALDSAATELLESVAGAEAAADAAAPAGQ